jgi:hypothetical protein
VASSRQPRPIPLQAPGAVKLAMPARDMRRHWEAMRLIRTWTSRLMTKGNEVMRVLLGVAMATLLCGRYAEASVYAEIKDVRAGSMMSAGNTAACEFNFDVVADDNRYRLARPVFIQGSIFALTKNGHLALGLSIAPGDVPNHQSKPAAFFDPRYVWVAGEGKDTVGKEFRMFPGKGVARS